MALRPAAPEPKGRRTDRLLPPEETSFALGALLLKGTGVWCVLVCEDVCVYVGLSILACMYVCVYREYLCKHVNVRVFVSVLLSACIRGCVYLYVYVCTFVRIHKCLHRVQK